MIPNHPERGAAYVEYAIGVALLLGVFIIGSATLRAATISRGDAAMNSAATVIPCEVGLTGEECL